MSETVSLLFRYAESDYVPGIVGALALVSGRDCLVP